MMSTPAIEQLRGAEGIRIEELGAGERVILVHGGGISGIAAWQPQLALASEFRLVIPTRLGYPGSPPTAGEDFEIDARHVAELLGSGAHLIGHSYGAVGALLAAAMRPAAVRSLTVIDAACSAVARGHEVVDAYERRMKHLVAHPPNAASDFVRAVFHVLDPNLELPDPLPPPLVGFGQRLRTLRWPWEAEIPVEQLRGTPFPKLVISGGRNRFYEVISDTLQAQLGATRFVIANAGHHFVDVGAALTARLEQFLRNQS